MPDINFGEWMIIALIALIVVGPRNLPDLSRKIGGWMREARAMATDFRVGLEREIAELDEVRSDLKGMRDEVAKPLTEIKDELSSVSGELKPLDWTGPVTGSGPTPEDSARDFNRIHGIADAPAETESSAVSAEPEISAKRAAKNAAEPMDEGSANDAVAGAGIDDLGAGVETHPENASDDPATDAEEHAESQPKDSGDSSAEALLEADRSDEV